MDTDTLFYDLFVLHPEALARLVGLDPHAPWRFESVTLKKLERRVDGMLTRIGARHGPIFVEFQGYPDKQIYWRVFNEVTAWYLGQSLELPEEDGFTFYLIFLNDKHDPKHTPLVPVPPHRLVVLSLKEVLAHLEDPGALLTLEPLVLADEEALQQRLPEYRRMLEHLNPEEGDRKVMEAQLAHAILTRFRGLTREEVGKMLSRSVLKESRAVQECMDESRLEGRNEGLKEGRDEGLKEGRDEGLKAGRDEGLKAGRHGTARAMLLELWRLRFDEPAGWVQRRIAECGSVELLELLFRQLVIAPGRTEAELHVKLALGNGA